MIELKRELDVATRLAREAGALLLAHLKTGLTVEHKTSKEDPVTAADREASALITAGLAAEFPHDGLLSEEEADSAVRLGRERVWIIDPIDGTSEYAAGSPDYCVSIGLAMAGEPVLGVVYAPATDELFSGVVGVGVWKNGQPSGFSGRSEFIVSVSDTEHRRELHRYPLPGMQASGSIALKLGRLATGEADVTFTMSPRSEWDIAAGHALLRAAGNGSAGNGLLRRRDGREIQYNAPRPHITQGIIGGRRDAVEWLEGELRRHAIPTAHLGLSVSDPAWTLLTAEDQAGLSGLPGLAIRHANGKILALLVVDPMTRTVQRAEGDAFHLERLTRDVTRALGPLSLALSSGAR